MSALPMPPRDLSEGGLRLWRQVWEASPDLGPTERVLLSQACRLVTRADAVAVLAEVAPMGEAGKVERDLSLALVRLLAALKVDTPAVGAARRPGAAAAPSTTTGSPSRDRLRAV